MGHDVAPLERIPAYIHCMLVPGSANFGVGSDLLVEPASKAAELVQTAQAVGQTAVLG